MRVTKPQKARSGANASDAKPKTKLVRGVWLDEVEDDRVKEIAKSEDRSISWVIRDLIRTHPKFQGGQP